MVILIYNVQGSVHRKCIPFDMSPTRCTIIRSTQLYLQYLVLVKPLLLPAAVVDELELV